MEAILSNLLKKNNEIIERKNNIIKIFAVVGIIVAVFGVGYAIYKHFADNCCDDYEDEFDEDVAEEFFEED